MYVATINGHDGRVAYVTDTETGMTLVLHEAGAPRLSAWEPHHTVIDGRAVELPSCFTPRPEIYAAIEAADHERLPA